MNGRAKALLPNGTAYGTLAAARSLGRAGFEVTIADASRLAPARWSRHVAHAVGCPDVEAEPDGFLAWLYDYGARNPGTFLYPTSDEVAWLVSRHRDDLARHYRLYAPPFAAVDALLDKYKLHEACVALEISDPATWRAGTDEELVLIAREARFPVVIKPRTQAFLAPHQKGRVAQRPDALAARVADFRAATRYAPMIRDLDPAILAPLAQAFHAGAADGIYNLSGFVDETGDTFVVAGSRKVLQWPRRLGTGLCFEEVAVAPAAASAIQRLSRHVGYHGAFEVEFLEADGALLLIDFNPRFYGQMAFDIARGLDLPRLVDAASLGDRAALESLVARARAALAERAPRVYTNRIELEITLPLLGLAGAMDGPDRSRWRRWIGDHHALTTDAVLDADDRMPAVTAALSSMLRRIAHPRSTWRGARSG